MDRLACGRSFALVVCVSLSGFFGCDDRRYEIPPIDLPPRPDGGGMPEVMLPSFEVPPAPDAPAPDDGPDAPMGDPDGGTGPADAGPFCGNSLIETGEVCDDGNGRPGDGCSGVCTVEPNYSCPAAGPALRLAGGLRRRQDLRQRGLRRRQRRRRRRLQRQLPGRGGLRVQRGGQALHRRARPPAAVTAR